MFKKTLFLVLTVGFYWGCGSALTPEEQAEELTVVHTGSVSVGGVLVMPHQLRPVPEPFELLGEVAVTGSIRRLDVQGKFAYLGTESYGFSIVDVSNPKNPKVASEVGFYDGYIYDIDAHGSYVYIANNTAGLRIFDVSDKTAPVQVDLIPQYKFDSNVLGVFAQGNKLYVSSGDGGLSIWDISAPDQINADAWCNNGKKVCAAGFGAACDGVQSSLLGCYLGSPSGGYFHDVVVENDIAYAGEALDGFQVLDVSDPSDVQLLSTGSLVPGQPLDVAVHQGVLYGASYGWGLTGADVTPLASPLTPTLSYQVAGFGGSEGLAVGSNRSKTYAYVGSSAGLEVVDVTDQANLSLVKSLSSAGVRDAVYKGGKVYAAASTQGLLIYDGGL